MSQMSDALDIHVDRLQAFAGEPVIYHRGSSGVSCIAVVGQTDFDETIGESEVTVNTRSVDFLFDASELKLGGVSIEPTRGDQIERESGDIFDVLPGVSTTLSQWSDGRRNMQRVHTVRRISVTGQ